jgi:hypothetical protein
MHKATLSTLGVYKGYTSLGREASEKVAKLKDNGTKIISNPSKII